MLHLPLSHKQSFEDDTEMFFGHDIFYLFLCLLQTGTSQESSSTYADIAVELFVGFVLWPVCGD